MTTTQLTLIFTQRTLPNGWQAAIDNHLQAPWHAHLFFLDQGVFLVDQIEANPQFSGEKIYCAYGHSRLNAPQPNTEILPGGLANLGGMIRASDYTLSLPACHWPNQSGTTLHKQVAILLNDTPTSQLEAARLAAGLAGCSHKVTLYHPINRPPADFPLAATPYLEAIHALGGTITSAPTAEQLTKNHDLILQL